MNVGTSKRAFQGGPRGVAAGGYWDDCWRGCWHVLLQNGKVFVIWTENCFSHTVATRGIPLNTLGPLDVYQIS